MIDFNTLDDIPITTSLQIDTFSLIAEFVPTKTLLLIKQFPEILTPGDEVKKFPILQS